MYSLTEFLKIKTMLRNCHVHTPREKMFKYVPKMFTHGVNNVQDKYVHNFIMMFLNSQQQIHTSTVQNRI